jgi:CDP-glucose 4,6-dehydratase
VEGVQACVIVTTDKCYDNQEWQWAYRENDRLGGKDPYSSSKACAELVTSAYRQSFFTRGVSASPTMVATVRAGNVIGGGDWAADRLVPDVVRGFLAGEPVRVRSPHAVRPWQHVLEPVSGYLTLARRLVEDGDPHSALQDGWNFGPSEEDARSVEWIVERMCERWGEGAAWVRDENPHPPEATILKLDSSRARAELGWRPRLALPDALDWTVQWYRASQHGDDLRAVTERQIADYQALATGDAAFTSMPV